MIYIHSDKMGETYYTWSSKKSAQMIADGFVILVKVSGFNMSVSGSKLWAFINKRRTK